MNTALSVGWFVATIAIAVLLLGFTVLLARSGRRKLYPVATVMGALLALCINPLVNLAVTQNVAERYRRRMLEDAQREHCVGRPSEWLIQRFGKPTSTLKLNGVEHWFYAPGPWYVLKEEDYVGFEIKEDIVRQAYMQIN